MGTRTPIGLRARQSCVPSPYPLICAACTGSRHRARTCCRWIIDPVHVQICSTTVDGGRCWIRTSAPLRAYSLASCCHRPLDQSSMKGAAPSTESAWQAGLVTALRWASTGGIARDQRVRVCGIVWQGCRDSNPVGPNFKGWYVSRHISPHQVSCAVVCVPSCTPV